MKKVRTSVPDTPQWEKDLRYYQRLEGTGYPGDSTDTFCTFVVVGVILVDVAFVLYWIYGALF